MAREAGRPEQAGDSHSPSSHFRRFRTTAPSPGLSASWNFMVGLGLWVMAMRSALLSSNVYILKKTSQDVGGPQEFCCCPSSVMEPGSQLHDKQTRARSVSSFLGHGPPRAHRGPRSASGLTRPLFAGPAFMSGKFSLILHRITQ